VKDLDQTEEVTWYYPFVAPEIQLALRALAFLGRADKTYLTLRSDEHPQRPRLPLRGVSFARQLVLPPFLGRYLQGLLELRDEAVKDKGGAGKNPMVGIPVTQEFSRSFEIPPVL